MKCNIHKYLFFCCCFLLMGNSYAQTDSTKLYKRIQKFTDQRQFTKFLHKLIFRPIYKDVQPKVYVKTNVKQVYYLPFQGKVIRDIEIVTFDPFGYDTRDVNVIPTNIFQKVGNSLHIKSMVLTIRNRLIIKRHDIFDSLRVRESERLIRSQNYVREIVVSPRVVGNGDSVDIYIRVYDVWSIIATGAASQSSFNIDARDKNFLGLGHQFQNNYSLNHTNGNFKNETNYYISNIKDSYINAVLHYDVDRKRNYNEYCIIDRPFYSAFTKWAGGITFQQQLNRSDLILPDSSLILQTYKNNRQDYWLGRSWQLFRGGTENERTTNFILSGRYLRVNYPQKPPINIDTLNSYSDENFYMVSAGFSKRKYKQDNYIFKFGFTEDIPVGKVYSVMTGYRVKGNIGRWYIGPRFYWGSYYQWGYFSTNLEYGTFIHKEALEEGSFAVGLNYFSPILNIGRWRIRQFVKTQFTQGFNRLKSESLSLGNESGIRGFRSDALSGTQKVVLTLQTQSYAPWNILGFRFGPYLVCSFGILGKESSGFHRSPVYSQFGLGLLIKNEFLVINSFEVSIAYYPFTPGAQNDIIKINPFKTRDFGFRDASITQPSTVTYQ